MATSEISATPVAVDNPSALEPHTEAGPSSALALKNSTTHSLNSVLVPIEASASDAPPLPAPGQRSLRQKAEHIWNGLPTAAKTTLILAVIGSILLIAYSIVALIIAIILTSLMLARVLWFISTRPVSTTLLPFKVIFGAIISGVLVAFILVALLSCRQFGWRLYSRLGVDYRQKGAEKLQRLAFVAHAFNALVKLDSIFLITVSALGIDVSIEHRETPSATILGLTIGNFFLCAAITVWGVITASTSAAALQQRRLLVFDIVAPLSFLGPIALIVIYSDLDDDVANAWVSLLLACLVFMGTRFGLWAVLHAVVRNTAKMGFVAGRVVVRASTKGNNSSSKNVDTLVEPLHEGAWLGKPAPRNPRKIRFFQLSHDGSTLRWGWTKFVRLYYVQEVVSSPEALTLTLTFVLDSELTLLFPNEVVLEQWRRGIEHAMVLLMRPDGDGAPGSSSMDSLHSNNVGKRERTAGRGRGAAAQQTTAQGAAASARAASASLVDSHLEEGVLRILGMNIRRVSKPSSNTHPARGGTPEANELECSTPPIISRSHSTAEVLGTATPLEPLLPTTAAPNNTAVASAGQLQKRQRMAAFLSAAAAATMGRLQSSGGKIPFSSPPSSSIPMATSSGVSAVPAGTSPGSARMFLPWLRATMSPAAAATNAATGEYADGEDIGLKEGGSLRKKRRGTMVSVGTQTDDIEIENGLSSASVDQEGPAVKRTSTRTTGTVTSDEENAYLASGYAGLMAAAAAAAGAGNGGLGGCTSNPTPSAAAGGFGFGQRFSETPGPLPALPPVDGIYTTNTSPSQLGALALSIPDGVTGAPNPGSNSLHGGFGVNFGGIRSPTAVALATGTATTTPGTPVAFPPAASASATSPNTLMTPSSSQLAISVDVIDYEELAMGKLLGAGSEGAVYAAWYLETPVAVKRFNRVEDSLHEVAMYLGVGSHDNVVALRALCQHENAMYLILEYCPRGTLDAMLHHSAPQQWEPARLVPLVRSIARGMHHLHSRGIVHRDLKPANIFIGHGQTMKVGDFGMARYVGPSSCSSSGGPLSPTSPLGSPPNAPPTGLIRLSPGVIGTTQYAAPELINEDLRPQTESDAEWAMKVDVWSFGVTLWEIMERKRPFEGASSVAVEAMWLNNPYQARMPPVKVPESVDVAGKRVIRGLSDLVEDCTRVDPMARPSFGAVLRRLRTLSSSSSSSSSG
ncbi:hypothetical protein Ndes2526A_g07715 [Nannochloris sp. 'desiccata']